MCVVKQQCPAVLLLWHPGSLRGGCGHRVPGAQHRRSSSAATLEQPYLYARAQVQGIPVVAFDVGGVGEMLNTSAAADIIVAEPTAEALAAKLAQVPVALVLPVLAP